MEHKKKSKAFLAKEKTVAEIENYVKNAKSVTFVDYRKTNVSEISALRTKFRGKGVVYKVYKNNLMKIALNNLGITGADKMLVGTLAVAFSNHDEVTAPKVILDQKFENKMQFKFGILGTSILDAHGVEQLSKMPSKETLVAQILGLINMGARNLASCINAVPRNLAVVTSEYAKQIS